MKKAILVSACLIGEPCRFDGQAKPSPAVLSLRDSFRLIPVCPEVFGGLPTPRVPSERRGDRVMAVDGQDTTEAYARGARTALSVALREGVAFAVLKARSPSCGRDLIYDGTFTRTLVPGNGVTVEALSGAGIPVFTEEEVGTPAFFREVRDL